MEMKFLSSVNRFYLSSINKTTTFIMKTPRPYRKFQFKQEKIKDLEAHNPRFKRIYTEFENLSDEIWEIETGDRDSVPDDFMFALQLQTNYLEDEIDEWIDNNEKEQHQ